EAVAPLAVHFRADDVLGDIQQFRVAQEIERGRPDLLAARQLVVHRLVLAAQLEEPGRKSGPVAERRDPPLGVILSRQPVDRGCQLPDDGLELVGVEESLEDDEPLRLVLLLLFGGQSGHRRCTFLSTSLLPRWCLWFARFSSATALRLRWASARFDELSRR